MKPEDFVGTFEKDCDPPKRGGHFGAFILGATILAVGIAVVLAGWALNSNHNRADSAHSLAVAIQQERLRAISQNCRENNKRYDNAVRILDKAIEKAPAAQKKRSKANRATTIAFIDALAPHRDCKKLVASQVKITP